MKITKSKLKQLIKEELQSIMEADDERAIMRAAAARQRGRYRKGAGKFPVKPSFPKKRELTPEEQEDVKVLNKAWEEMELPGFPTRYSREFLAGEEETYERGDKPPLTQVHAKAYPILRAASLYITFPYKHHRNPEEATFKGWSSWSDLKQKANDALKKLGYDYKLQSDYPEA